ncbi:MAG: PAS domain S-box protein [Cohnella sp.]|nr:PAS domain S-box protein [Cohnella sp.]
MNDIWPAWIAAGLIAAAGSVALGRQLAHRRRRQEASVPSYHSELLNSLYNSSPVAFAVIDKQGRFLDINQDPTDLIGYDKSEMIGEPLVHFVDVLTIIRCKFSLRRFEDRTYRRKFASCINGGIRST